MPKRLNQILAEERGVKTTADAVITDLHQKVQKAELLNGLAKTYEPASADENAERFPPEVKLVVLKATDAVIEIKRQMEALVTITASKDAANTVAKANIEVDGQVLATDVPATHLLWLEKQLTLLKSVIEKLPTLDPSEVWSKDTADGLFKTAPVKRVRTEKVQKPLVLYPATDKHPAQTQMITEDKTIGHWTHVKSSGALRSEDVKAMAERLGKLTRAVKAARATANMVEVPAVVPHTAAVLGYIFDGK